MDHDLECEINDVCFVMSLLGHLAIAQLVERRTVECKEAILRSLVRIRFARIFFSFSFFMLSVVKENIMTTVFYLLVCISVMRIII